MNAATSFRAATICRRFYLEGMSKQEIGHQFGISRFKVARILDESLASGVVQISIKSSPGIDADLSERLRRRFKLRQAVVATLESELETDVRSQLGGVAAEVVRESVSESDVLGIGWGRTLDVMTTQLEGLAPCAVVQMVGVVGPLNHNALELVRRISAASGGPGFPLYAPMLMSDEHTASVIRTQPQVAAVLKRFADITFAVVAIGSFDPPNSQLLAALPASEQSGLVRLGVRAEFSSTLLNEAGEIVAPEFANRTIAISAKQLKAIPEVLAVAGGINKATAIRAVLRGGFLTSLVTDDGVAKLLLADRVAKESDDIDSSRRDVQRRHRKLAVIP